MKAACYKLIFVVFFPTSCVLTEQKILRSQWADLNEAREIECSIWPERANQLRIEDISPFINDNIHLFLVEATSRSGRPFRYLAHSKTDSINSRFKGDIVWPDKSRFLGNGIVKGRNVVLLAIEGSQDKIQLELRDAAKNFVIARSLEIDPDTYLSDAYFNDSGFVLTARKSVEEVAIVDQEFTIHRYLIKGNSLDKISSRREWNGDEPHFYKKNGSKTDEFLGIWFDRKGDSGSPNGIFRLVDIPSNFKNRTIKNLELKLEGQVDSWSSVQFGDKIILSIVSGDTLLWEDAKLNIFEITTLGSVKRLVSHPIHDRHVGDPFLLAGSDDVFILLPQWLDYESTAGLYRLGTDSLEHLANYGVFSVGSSIKQAFTDRLGQRVFLIYDRPSTFSRQVNLCSIELKSR